MIAAVALPMPYLRAPMRRRPVVFTRLAGMGGMQSQQINQIVTTGAATTVSILASLHAVIGGIAFAGPVGAAIAGLIAVGSLIANQFHGCGQTCVQASKIADQVGPILQQNFDTYMSAPVHYRSLQVAALNNFDTVWAAMVQACSDPNLQDAGKRCISDRQQGACHWKNDGHGGPDGSGNVCWNWFVGMRDPIANDPNVVPDPTVADSILDTVGIANTDGNKWALLGAGLVLAGVML
jgi:hypothetical protein